MLKTRLRCPITALNGGIHSRKVNRLIEALAM
jgi:hypothetical protein